VVKVPYRKACLCKLQVHNHATEDEIDVAINVALHEDGTRLFMNAVNDAGIVKTMPNSQFNER
jgi:hypothetical protein